MKVKTTNLDKIHEVREQSQIIGEFLAWLSSKDNGICLCEPVKIQGYFDEVYAPIHETINSLLYRYFGIDENAAEQERMNLLKQIREINIPVAIVEHK
jgi:hypothetical protein